MSNSEELTRRAELIILNLAKFHVLLELSMEQCLLCRRASAHDAECPIALAWSCLDTGQQDEVRRHMRALALSMGAVNASTDTLVH